MDLTREEVLKLSPEEQYQYFRLQIESRFIEANRKGKPTEVLSPSGKYRLVTSIYSTEPGKWEYTRGQVYSGDTLIADVKRNYSSFWHAWVEDHPNGHSYFLCGENYQGHTIIELDTKKRIDSRPREGMQREFTSEHGFCWAFVEPSPDKLTLALEGCFWAAPYETLLLDFSEPMKLPYPEYPIVGNWPEAESFDTWVTEGKILIKSVVEIRKSDGKALRDLSYEEQEEAEISKDTDEKTVNTLWDSKTRTGTLQPTTFERKGL
jgi:hypothetical protein